MVIIIIIINIDMYILFDVFVSCEDEMKWLVLECFVNMYNLVDVRNGSFGGKEG